MGIITGYLTCPKVRENIIMSRVDELKKQANLETRFFKRIRRDGRVTSFSNLLGVLFSGTSNLSSNDVMKIMYKTSEPKSIRGLTYDVSSSFEDEDYEVGRLNLQNENIPYMSYFALRVKVDSDNRRALESVEEFNERYLSDGSITFRFVEPNYVAYDHIVSNIRLNDSIKHAQQILVDSGLNLDNRKITIIQDLI